MATKSYRRNTITQLTLSDGRVIYDHYEKATALCEAYRNCMGITTMRHMYFELNDLLARVQELDVLTLPFLEEEIDQIVKSIPIDKAPTPDGFNGLFF